MNPYLLAHRFHTTGTPAAYDWPDVLDFHFQHGLVISSPAAFVLARWVDLETPQLHPKLVPCPPQHRTALHVWLASGSIPALLKLQRTHAPSCQVVTYQRGNRSPSLYLLELPHMRRRRIL